MAAAPLSTEPLAAGGAELGAFAAALAHRLHEHVVGPVPGSGRPVLERDPAGDWSHGPYAGELRMNGAALDLRPAMGWDALTGWVEAATDLPAAGLAADAPTAVLAALIWARAVDGASRHGPPAFRRDVGHTGGGVRGRLDVRTTVRLRAKGSSEAASVYRSRDLDNPITRIVVAADRALSRQVSGVRWRTDRVEQVLPQLYSAVGRRAPVPADAALARVRYTPITRPFKWAAEISRRVVRQDVVLTTPRPRAVQGLLVDLEAVALAALLNWSRQARPDLRGDVEARRVVLRDGDRMRARLTVHVAAGGGVLVDVTLAGGDGDRLEVGGGAPAARERLAAILANV